MPYNNCPHCFSTDCPGYCQKTKWTPAHCPICENTDNCDNRGYCHKCKDWVKELKIKKEKEEVKKKEQDKRKYSSFYSFMNNYRDIPPLKTENERINSSTTPTKKEIKDDDDKVSANDQKINKDSKKKTEEKVEVKPKINYELN